VRAFSSEVETGSRQENASKQNPEPRSNSIGTGLCADIVAKVFLGGRTNFLEPLMRFTSGDVSDHIVSSKIDHGSP
jgi:hypothetical protein